MDHFGPFWPREVYFGPFRSANRTLATPDCSPNLSMHDPRFTVYVPPVGALFRGDEN